MAKDTIFSVKRYIGVRTPVLGTPLVFFGIKDDTKSEKLSYEIFFFLEGITKYFAQHEFDYNYGEVDSDYKDAYKTISTDIVEAEIEKILVEAMDACGIPRQLYRKLEEISQEDCKLHIQSLKFRGAYNDEIEHIARKSLCFQMEFSEMMQLPNISVKIAAVKR